MGKVEKGNFNLNDKVELKVDHIRRDNIIVKIL